MLASFSDDVFFSEDRKNAETRWHNIDRMQLSHMRDASSTESTRKIDCDKASLYTWLKSCYSENRWRCCEDEKEPLIHGLSTTVDQETNSACERCCLHGSLLSTFTSNQLHRWRNVTLLYSRFKMPETETICDSKRSAWAFEWEHHVAYTWSSMTLMISDDVDE